MKRFENRRALVTGASSGIGQAIALALVSEGAEVHAVARAWQQKPAGLHLHQADLSVEADVSSLVNELGDPIAPFDLLIHSAGMYANGDVAEMSVQTLDQLYQVNVRAPFLLTQKLLPRLLASKGQIVFINSSAGLVAKGGVGGYAASKFALKALADALRDEVNASGVRVMSVYPGKTASKMQEAAHKMAGKPYTPANLMQPEDVAQMVLSALALPPTAELTDLHIRPMKKG